MEQWSRFALDCLCFMLLSCCMSFLWLADLSATNILILLKCLENTVKQQSFVVELRNVRMAIAKPVQRKGFLKQRYR